MNRKSLLGSTLLAVTALPLRIRLTHVFRRDFPVLDHYVNGRRLVWLDNGATTQKPEAVIDRLVRFYKLENSKFNCCSGQETSCVM